MKKAMWFMTGLLVAVLANAQSPMGPLGSGSSTNVYVQDLESAVAQLREEITTLKRSLERDIQALQAQLAALSKQIGERRGPLSPFDSLERRAAELERDLKDIESTLKRLDSRIQKLESKR